MKVKNMKTSKGNIAENQFLIEHEGAVYFQSGDLMIARIKNDNVILDREYWSYSLTTLKYLNKFLGTQSRKEIATKILSGQFKVGDLN